MIFDATMLLVVMGRAHAEELPAATSEMRRSDYLANLVEPPRKGLEYEYVPRGCVPGDNIVLYKDKSVAECAALCYDNWDCMAFEYGVDYGKGGPFEPRDCQLQSSANLEGCDGSEWNLDLYVFPPEWILVETPSGIPTTEESALKATSYEYVSRGCVTGNQI